MNGRLPRAVTRLLLRVLPADLRESIAGDLGEEYRVLCERRGPAVATAWAWLEAVRLVVVFRWERAIHGRPLPPIADEAPTGLALWDSIRQDVGFGVRMLRRQPGFTVVAILALALGIGANTAIFSIVDAVLWRPLPFNQPDAIMSVAEQRPREGRMYGAVSPADFYDWRRDSTTFSDMAAYMEAAFNLTGGAEPEQLRGLRVTPGFLRVLATPPALGRDFHPDEDTRGRHRVVLLSNGLWRRAFGGDARIVGHTVSLDGEPYEVVGVLPASFWWPTAPDFLAPLALTDHDRGLRTAHFLNVVGRLRPGVSEAQAREELNLIGRHLEAAYPAANTDHYPSLRPLRTSLVGDARTALLVLLGAVGLVLLIACANVATLLLARATERQKELAIRAALGAARGRLARQFLIESAMLAIAGGAAGMLLAQWCLAGFQAFLPAQFPELPGIAAIGIDARVLWMAIAGSLATGLVFGVVPAVVASDQRGGVALAGETRGGTGHAKSARFRAALVVAEVALSLVLLVGAVLLMVSFRNLVDVAPGFRPHQLVTTPLTLSPSRYGDHASVTAFYATLFARLRARPGMLGVAATSAVPFSGFDVHLDLEIENRAPTTDQPVRADALLVSDGYFTTMGIPLVGGRRFDAHDNGSARDVAILNQEAARRYWPNADPLGQRISLGSPRNWMIVVGIVGDVRDGGLDAAVKPEAYIPLAQGFASLGSGLERGLTLVVRSSAEPSTVTSFIRSAVKSVDAQQPVGVVTPMDELIARSVAPRRLNFLLLGAFAFMAIALTAAGLYGVMVYLVEQRTREIGVRIALGASRQQVVALVLRQAGAMTLAGIGIGILGALALTRTLGSLLFGVSATSPVIYASVSGLLALVALVAVAVPSSRATHIDPLTALRDS